MRAKARIFSLLVTGVLPVVRPSWQMRAFIAAGAQRSGLRLLLQAWSVCKVNSMSFSVGGGDRTLFCFYRESRFRSPQCGGASFGRDLGIEGVLSRN
jgi:hypothetical protein